MFSLLVARDLQLCGEALSAHHSDPRDGVCMRALRHWPPRGWPLDSMNLFVMQGTTGRLAALCVQSQPLLESVLP